MMAIRHSMCINFFFFLLLLHTHLPKFRLEILSFKLLNKFGIGLLPLFNNAFSGFLDIFPILLLRRLNFTILQIFFNLFNHLQHIFSLASIRSNYRYPFTYLININFPGQFFFLYFDLDQLHFLCGLL